MAHIKNVDNSTYVLQIHAACHRRNLKGGGGDKGRQMPPPQYFFNLGIVYLVTELNNGKYKIDRKKKMKNLRFMGPIFPSFKFDSFVK
jgi:hypothetical protein